MSTQINYIVKFFNSDLDYIYREMKADDQQEAIKLAEKLNEHFKFSKLELYKIEYHADYSRMDFTYYHQNERNLTFNL